MYVVYPCCVAVNKEGMPTPKARALGSALREAREARALTLRDLGEQLGRDPGLLSRWETGKRIPKPTDVAQLLTNLGVNGEHYDEIIELTHGTDEPLWIATTLPEQRQQMAALLVFERSATTITQVAPLLIPGYLQTNDYARTIMSAGGVRPDEVETRVAVRIGRRDVITRKDPANLVALIGEAALRHVVGSHAVMVEQLRYLTEVAALDNVQLLVVPFESGWQPALEGMFMLLESKEETSPVVHLENRRSGLFLHEDEDVGSYRRAVDTVREVAMTPEESTGLIAEVANQMETKQ